jgi:hypothetical protein
VRRRDNITCINLQNWIAETYKGDELLFTLDKKDENYEILKQVTTGEAGQRNHDSRAANCMMHEETTTLEYQLAKHDDYGKIKASATAK